VSELRDHLSKYLAQVKEGREAVITEHGKPVARLVPSTPAHDRRAQLIAEGRVTPAKSSDRTLPPPIKLKGDGTTVSEILVEQRRR
jgi:prevent-host-death family protein